MVNKVLQFTWDEWKWLAVIIMLGVVMYWTALVIEPTFDLVSQNAEVLKSNKERAERAESNVKLILENQDNNTKILRDAQRNFVTLYDQHLNTTQAIFYTQATNDIILKQLSQLTNDIYIMQKAELESRKTLGKFLALMAENNNMTIPFELKKNLFIEDSNPQQSSPH